MVHLDFFALLYMLLMRRKDLWEDLKSFKTHLPWLVCGDFNCLLHTDERIGSLVREGEIQEFRACVDDCHITDIKSSGNFFTWNNKQQGEARVFSLVE